MQRIVEDKVRQLLPRSVTKDKHESLAANVAALRSELERKATVAYVDDSLRRKLDKSDAVVRQLATSGADLQVSLRALVYEWTLVGKQYLLKIGEDLLKKKQDLSD